MACVVLLTVLSVSGTIWEQLLHQHTLKPVVRAFDLDEEMNVPTAYQSITLLASAVLLYGIARRTRQAGLPDAGYWIELSLVFLFLFIDETVRIHERLGQFRDHVPLHAGRLFRSGWIIFGAAFATVVGVINLRFLLRLPRRTAIAFVGAGVVFIAGAGGMEVAVGPWITAHGRENFIYSLSATAEEVLEMVGIVIFIRALMEYRRRFVDATIARATSDAKAPVPSRAFGIPFPPHTSTRPVQAKTGNVGTGPSL